METSSLGATWLNGAPRLWHSVAQAAVWNKDSLVDWTFTIDFWNTSLVWSGPFVIGSFSAVCCRGFHTDWGAVGAIVVILREGVQCVSSWRGSGLLGCVDTLSLLRNPFSHSPKLRCSNLAGLENGGTQRLTEHFLLPRDMWCTPYTLENCFPQNPGTPWSLILPSKLPLTSRQGPQVILRGGKILPPVFLKYFLSCGLEIITP